MRAVSVCSVVGCENPVGRTGGKGYCRKHYSRFRAHGDPLAGGTGKGEVQEFMRWIVTQDTDECIQFPFYRSAHGYGRYNPPGGEAMGAHVYIATAVHGEKPSPDHEACHVCGNGHNGCVTPRHLYWGTRKDNVADAIAHGTAKFWGIPMRYYSEFRAISAEILGPLKDEMVAGRYAANDNVPEGQRRVA